MKKQEIIDVLKQKINITEYISRYVQLSKVGSGSEYVGKCPFHNDKNPSFYVSEDKWVYHCFGCGASGNLITFVMNYHHLTYEEAVKHLLKYAKINIKIEEYNDLQKQIFELNKFVQRIFIDNINFAKKPKMYLKNRGLDDKLIEKFGLGYCSKKQSEYLIKKVKNKFPPNIIKASGYMEPFLFEDRVTIPLKDKNGKIMTFSGRTLNKEEKAKYINGHGSPVFEKGGFLYNLNNVKLGKDITVVEGYFDVIALDKIGISAVAVNTSQVSDKQARLLKRYFKKVILMLDGDKAGINGMFRSLESLLDYFEPNQIKAVILPGIDPDEAVKNGIELNKMISNAENLFDILMNKAAKEEKYIKTFLTMLNKLNIINQKYYIYKFSKLVNASPESIKRDMLKVNRRHYINFKKNMDAFERIQRSVIIAVIKYPDLIDKIDARFMKEPYKTMIQYIKNGVIEAPEDFNKELKDKWYSLIINNEAIKDITEKFAVDAVKSYNNYIQLYFTNIKNNERGDT